ncbi:helix-turn-helix transcriptional regulator [Streptomyces sp. Je 1-332]|uniref:helix-turn-helix domain-containing protein n=1 Tax=Streptomyces sp. Je 1-332 TaxID=3231270 RepID=UPI00345905B4
MANGSRQAAWEFFGAELRRRREDAGLTQSSLGLQVFVSGAYIGQFEQAIRKPQLDVAQRIDEILQSDGIFERMCRKLINDSRYAEYFAQAAELEALATRVCDFAPAVVPGLLQTAPYARALTVATNPYASDEYVEEKVQARLERAHILKDPDRPKLWVILHEHVLCMQVGEPADMIQQFQHVTALMRTRRVLVQVLPFSAGPSPALHGTLRLMEFDDAPPTAYTEAVFSGNLLDDPAMVKRAQETYDLLRAAALSPEASLALIASAAEDYRQCTGST